MTTHRSSPGRRVLHLLGLLGARRDQMFYVPSLRVARPLLAANGVLTVVLVAELGFKLNPWLSWSLALALFLLALRFLPRAERLLALGLLVLPFLVAALAPNSAWLVLLLPLLAVLAFASLVTQHRALAFDAQLSHLREVLGAGWKAYLPRDEQAQDVARVLVSPQGQTFFLGVTFGRAAQQYGTPHVNWQGVNQETVRALAARDWGVASQGQKVLWVVRPPNAQGEYPPTAEHGVSTVIATSADLAAQLNTWAGMQQNLADASPGEFGMQVEVQATDDLLAVLPPGWQLRQSILLASGGDADIVLTSPSHEVYVVDIKSRTDRMDLETPRGERAKSWQEIHDQVERAAWQLNGVAVVWQPRAREVSFTQVGDVWCLRGGARELIEALETIDGVKHGFTPHEVLGVRPDASSHEIQEAYRALVKKYHPDRVGHLGEEFRVMAEERMQEINAAYRQLMGR
ncbi:J domain-containing protein [Deinococcus aestuarii]|uniref:J domain-containing protein n=1 Tax=Deinococcus aestuarii TaxID=2774531 RepID=UPI001C0AAB23|nr:J domain-containing protein [Deinococcus aestuarii]